MTEINGQMALFGEEAVTTESTTNAAPTTAGAKGMTADTTKGAGKSKAPKKAAIPAPEPKPPVKVFGDWKADFYGNVFEVSDYVEEIPEDGIEVEELRQEMQKDFFGLSKERAYWEVDEENKYIFLFQKGTHKGASFTETILQEMHDSFMQNVGKTVMPFEKTTRNGTL